MVDPIISWYGERAINIAWPTKIEPDLHDFLLHYESFLLEKYSVEIIETVTTYHTILVCFQNRSSAEKCLNDLQISHPKIDKKERKRSFTYTIPVCYDDSFGWDIEFVANKCNCTVGELIKKHTAAVYRIYFIGFLPGFIYLGGLNEELHVPRKDTPRLKVKQGAVGIGGSQTGIYPNDSPGGWQIIGHTPITLFNTKQNPPCPFNPGDNIRFQSVSLSELTAIKAKIKKGNYNLIKSPSL